MIQLTWHLQILRADDTHTHTNNSGQIPKTRERFEQVICYKVQVRAHQTHVARKSNKKQKLSVFINKTEKSIYTYNMISAVISESFFSPLLPNK